MKLDNRLKYVMGYDNDSFIIMGTNDNHICIQAMRRYHQRLWILPLDNKEKMYTIVMRDSNTGHSMTSLTLSTYGGHVLWDGETHDINNPSFIKMMGIYNSITKL